MFAQSADATHDAVAAAVGVPAGRAGPSSPQRHRPGRHRRRGRRRRRRGRHAGEHAAGMAIDVGPPPAGARRRAAAGCRAPPSTRSRCGPSTTSTPRCRRCRSSASAASPTRPRRRAAARRRVGRAGRHGHVRRPRAPSPACSPIWQQWCGRHGVARRVRSRRRCPWKHRDRLAPRARRRRPRRRGAPGAACCARGSASPRSASSCTAPPAPRRSARCASLGYAVFCDLKLHDIPTTVQRRGAGARLARRRPPHAPRVGRRGHAARRCRGPGRGRRGGRRARADRAGRHRAHERGRGGRRHMLAERVAAAVEAGCGGIVCAAADVRDAKRLAPAPPRRRARHPPGGGAGPRPGDAGHARAPPSPPAPTSS